MPRYEWMLECTDAIIDSLGTIREYAKKSYKNKNVYDKIKIVSDLIKNNFNIN